MGNEGWATIDALLAAFYAAIFYAERKAWMLGFAVAFALFAVTRAVA